MDIYLFILDAYEWLTTNASDSNMVAIGAFLVIVFSVKVLHTIFKTGLYIRRTSRARMRPRMYSAQQKNEGHKRAGNRCEFSSRYGRCKNKAVHADHFYPYSRGGATSMKNFVSACEHHNLSKGAKIPSLVEKSRIEARRAHYFPVGVSVSVGEWA